MHMTVLLGLVFSRVDFPRFSFVDFVQIVTSTLVISFSFALVLSLLIEAPMLKLEKLAFGKSDAKSTPTSLSTLEIQATRFNSVSSDQRVNIQLASFRSETSDHS